MTTDLTTANRGYQLPHGDNPLSHDVLRLIAALEAIDVDVASALASLALKAALGHTHPQSEVAGLETALNTLQTTVDGKPDLDDIALGSLNNVTLTSPSQGQLLVRGATAWNNAAPNASLITQGQFAEARMPTYLQASQLLATYAALSHGHAIADVSGLQTALDGKAASSHAHAISDVTGLQTALDGKADSESTVWFYGHIHGELDSSVIFESETRDWVIMLAAPYDFSINDFVVISPSGALTVTVRIDGVNVTGLVNVSVDATKRTYSASGANSVSEGNTVSFGLGAVSTADEHFSWALKGTRT